VIGGLNRLLRSIIFPLNLIQSIRSLGIIKWWLLDQLVDDELVLRHIHLGFVVKCQQVGCL